MIQCNGQYDSCADMTVYSDNDLCVIKGNSIDRNRELNLFCKNGWTDIDISQWNNAQILYTIDTPPGNDTIITTMSPTINTTEAATIVNVTDLLVMNVTDTSSINITDVPSFNITNAQNSNTTFNTTSLPNGNITNNATSAPFPNSTFPAFNISTTMPFNDTMTTTFIPIDNDTWINLNVMHCGDNYDFECEINDHFNCTCPPITTASPTMDTSSTVDTIPPTPRPSMSPLEPGKTRSPTINQGINVTDGTDATPSPTKAENVDEWFVIGVTFIVLFGVVFYKQMPDPPAMAGTLLIIVGIIIIRFYSAVGQH